jgi:UV DNA damage endonuclease
LARRAADPDVPHLIGHRALCDPSRSAAVPSPTGRGRRGGRGDWRPSAGAEPSPLDASLAVHHADFLDALGTSSEAKIITHVGGVYGDRAAAIDRWVARYEMLAPSIRRRLVLENDEISYSVADILSIHRRSGVPLVFDILHHQVNGSVELSDLEACRACLATWPAAETPKIHYSSQRRADREVSLRDRATGARQTVRRPAKAGQHDDWIDAGEFVTFVRAMGDTRFDIMLEAKQKDRALLALRDAIAGAGLSERIW